VEGCSRKHEARGWCKLHYQRRISTGSTDDPSRYETDADRFWAKVERGGPDECWPWTANVVATYGHFWINGKTEVAHRVAYELTYGPIPRDPVDPERTLHVDHRCHSESTACPGGAACLHRLCQNPAHLEAVTMTENNRRAALVQSEATREKRRVAGRLGAAARWGAR
jgi:hypothetical protein